MPAYDCPPCASKIGLIFPHKKSISWGMSQMVGLSNQQTEKARVSETFHNLGVCKTLHKRVIAYTFSLHANNRLGSFRQ